MSGLSARSCSRLKRLRTFLQIEKQLDLVIGHVNVAPGHRRTGGIQQAQRIARRALSFETDRQVTNYLRDETKKLLPEDPI